MPQRSLLLLAYGGLAAAVLVCLWLVSLAPLRLSWGRELAGAAIALVALLIGAGLARRPPATAQPPVTEAGPPLPVAEAVPTAATETSLSQREREVLQRLAEGLSNKEIARALSVSENTVKTHLANLYAKLGVGRRTEALKVARQLGLA
jgi:DNA-binding NarL/FixJ family response regulator